MMTSGGGNAAQSDGGDIRFSSDAAGASQLACEIVLWTQNANPALAKAEIWVPVSVLTASDVTIYVWYSAGGAQAQPAANAAFGSQAVWDTNYSGVLHLSNGTTLSAADSTSNALSGTISNATASVGKIDGAASFNGSSAAITVTSAAPLNLSPNVTISFWFFIIAASNAWHGIFGKRNAGATDANYGINFNPAVGTDIFQLYYADAGGTVRVLSVPYSTNFATGSWYHIVGSFAQSGANTFATIYKNGASLISATLSGAPKTNADNLTLGQSYAGAEFANIQLDDFRVSRITRPAAWITTEYNNQNAPGTFLVAGTPAAVTAFQAAWAQGCNQMIGGGIVS